ncbi:NFX1-type zinc finger-containing protein 1 [Cyphellophora attinorum]|uniref:NFX1-type zinc finger-containing protein 1 n=1 Tax=Cyphellophora attinorum TaxID=1664694 RepID=A0A0N1NVY0_9EURO|nr:NFX1-type zinc finger-containing protein 1 [Phialophora attinorum]KPI35054.1 NFX1-type zinc finger-containing protein 1 [Phialophora attinorum]
MASRVCHFFQQGRCRNGESCRFSHSGPQQARGAKNDNHQHTDVFRVPRDDYRTLTIWLSQVQHPADVLPPRHLETWITTALSIVEADHVESKQRVTTHLATAGGLAQIKQLADSAPSVANVNDCKTFVDRSAMPLLKIISHPDIIRSALLEESLFAITGVIFGVGGTRAVRFFGSISAALSSTTVDTTLNMDKMAAALLVLDKVVDLCRTTYLASINAGRALNHLQALFERGFGLPLPTEISVATQVASFDLVVDGPGSLRPKGPRHSNDHQNISHIKILPSNDELGALHTEYLPVVDPKKSHLPGLAGVVDRNFRLLREDTIGMLRDAVRVATDNLRKSQNRDTKHDIDARSHSRTMLYEGVDLHGVRLGPKGLAMEVSFDQPKLAANKTKTALQHWWEASKLLNEEALVCLIGDGFAAFMMVCQEPSLSAKKGPKPATSRRLLFEDAERARVWLQLIEPDNFRFEAIDECIQEWEQRPLILCEFPGILLPSFYPTLQALQHQSSRLDVPFADLIASQTGQAHLDLDTPPDYARLPNFAFDLSVLVSGQHALRFVPGQAFDFDTLGKHSTLDAAQQAAIIDALSHRLALIQGPPGTGKSFCGVVLIKVLLANKKQGKLGPIICVCYTNHALDQLLEHLVADGVKQIVRIGGQSKSEALQEVNLRKVAMSMPYTASERKNYAISASHLEDLFKQIKPLLAKVSSEPTFDDVKEYLSVHSIDHHRQLLGLFQPEGENEEWKVVDYDKRSPLERFLHPKVAPPESNQLRNISELHGIPLADLAPSERQRLFDDWCQGIVETHKRSLKVMLEDYERAQAASRKIGDEQSLRCLDQANIIGLTTSGLARRIHLMRRLKSKVLICEEAGEVLEAHLITALVPRIEHCILIGDHEQLRPQIQNYDLQAANPMGRQYSLDMSLFERLISPPTVDAPRLPHTTLQIQRRMHPQISELIRTTLYPHLEDHPSVHVLPPVPGIAQRLFWLDHQEHEENKDHTRSFANLYEVEMVAAMVSHLVRQCQYGKDDIAVLTPYLGQLRLLKHRLRSMFEIVVDERDQADLVKHGIEDNDSPEGTVVSRTNLLSTVRLATVDNFQGEEAKVVVVSLVRSNAEKKCGFLRTTNRANVLLSRAQHGMSSKYFDRTVASVQLSISFAHVIPTLQLWSQSPTILFDTLQKAAVIGNASNASLVDINVLRDAMFEHFTTMSSVMCAAEELAMAAIICARDSVVNLAATATS